MTPGWTTATRFAVSISRILSIAVKAIVSPPSMPVAPPDSPDPAPRGTTGTRNSEANRSSSDTWAVSVGSATAPGRPGCRYAVSSCRYDSRSPGSVSSRIPGQARRDGLEEGSTRWRRSRSRAKCTGRSAAEAGVGWPAWPARPIVAAALTLAVVALLLPAAAPAAKPPPRSRSTRRMCRSSSCTWATRADLRRLEGDRPKHLRRRHRPARVQHDRDTARRADRCGTGAGGRRRRRTPRSATRRSSCRSASPSRTARRPSSRSATARRCGTR